jgi:hypothetical protein
MTHVGIFSPYEFVKNPAMVPGDTTLIRFSILGTGPEKKTGRERRVLRANSLYYKELAAPGKTWSNSGLIFRTWHGLCL